MDCSEAGKLGLGMLDVRDGEVSEQDRGIVGREQKGGEGTLVV